MELTVLRPVKAVLSQVVVVVKTGPEIGSRKREATQTTIEKGDDKTRLCKGIWESY